MIPRVLKVEGQPDLVKRDGTVVNTDSAGFAAFVAAREKRLQEQQQKQEMQEELVQLRKDYAELSEKVGILLEGLKNGS